MLKKGRRDLFQLGLDPKMPISPSLATLVALATFPLGKRYHGSRSVGCLGLSFKEEVSGEKRPFRPRIVQGLGPHLSLS